MLSLLAIPVIVGVLAFLLYCIASRPARIIFLIPFLLGFEYRVRLSAFSFDVSELLLLIVGLVCVFPPKIAGSTPTRRHSADYLWFVLPLAILAAPAVILESNTAHAASVYRDFVLPFVFFLALVRADIGARQVAALIKLTIAVMVANAGLGLIQYFSGNYLFLAAPIELEWQSYKTGLAKLSAFGDWIGVNDTLPVGLFTGANMFACFLSLPLCVTTVLAFSPSLRKSSRGICLVAAAVMLVCLTFTIFRSGLIVYAASLIVCYLYLGKRSLLRLVTVSVLAGVLAALFFAPGVFDWDQFGSFQGREDMISAAVALVRSHPELLFFGGYTDLYHLQSRESQEIHNLALYSIVQFGLPATVLFFTFFARIAFRALRAARAADGLLRALLASIVISISANVFLYGLSTMLIDSVQTSLWFMFWAGIAHNLTARIEVRDQAPAVVAAPVRAALPQQSEFA